MVRYFKIVLIVFGFSCFVGAIGASSVFGEERPSPLKTYRIGNGDVLSISTWKEEDFTKENLIVRLDGMITFPLIGDILAVGLTPQELQATIEEKLKEYVSTPSVTVTIRNPISQRFYILGEVQKTGEYALMKRLTVLQAFAIAGGFTQWASKKEIILLRMENGKEKVIRINYREIVKDQKFKNNVLLKADDTIIVP